MNAAAIMNADFKNGFGSQFNGLVQTSPDDSLYTGYTYNNWASKVPSPLGPKSFWGINSVNPLSSVVPAQSSMGTGVMPCFSPPTGSMNAPIMPPVSSQANASCPYAPPAPPMPYMYRSDCSSSFAQLRLKAKQHSAGALIGTSGLTSTGLSNYPQMSTSPRQNTPLSACQYATVDRAAV